MVYLPLPVVGSYIVLVPALETSVTRRSTTQPFL
jgi:hypothetical protein